MKQIDTRGLSCPQPIILVTKEIRNSKENFEILVDSEVTKENLERTLNQFKLKYQITYENNEIKFNVQR